MRISRLSKAVGLASLIVTSNVLADIQLNGFASIRGGTMFTSAADQGSIPYEENEFSFKPESLFAIQAKADMGEGLSATVQLLSEGSKDFDVEAAWAYFSYQINEQHTLHAGRLVNPLYYQAEYERVKYAQNTRLPQTVYQPIDFNTVEGIALDSIFDINNMSLRTKLIYGNWAGEAFLSSTGSWETLAIEELTGVNAELSGDWWKVFAGGWVAVIEFPAFNTGVVAGIAQSILDGGDSGIVLFDDDGSIKPEYAEFVDTIGWDQKDTFYTYVGFGLEYNNILLDSEYSRAGIWDATDAIDEAWYVSLGYRYNEFVFTLTTEDFSQASHFGYINDEPNADLRNAGITISTIFGTRAFDGNMFSIRYDFHPSAALKFDYFDGESNAGEFEGIAVGVDLVF